MTNRNEDLVREADRAMHVVWTAAVGTPGYDKKQWLALERAIWALRTKDHDCGPPYRAEDEPVVVMREPFKPNVPLILESMSRYYPPEKP